MRFFKYHALGNDYIVLNPADYPDWSEPSVRQIQAICHRNFGVGSDGILWGPLPSKHSDHGLRIFNPDGSEAEKSGNGLRIFSRYLWDHALVTAPSFSIETLGGHVQVTIHDQGHSITVEMGRVSFDSAAIPVTGPHREVLQESIRVLDRDFTYSAATIGNPHCVLLMPEISAELATHYGPTLEGHPYFPKKTNVQFLKIIDRGTIQIEIWERGAGYTLASGSSSSAAAAVAHKLGLVDSDITVRMPGGSLRIMINRGYEIRMTGSVIRVAEGQLHSDLFTFAQPSAIELAGG
jgi:diaminopimelate epimerase